MIRNHRTVICREGWYYMVVLAMVLTGAVYREVNLLLMLAGMLAGPLLFNWRAVRLTLRGLEVRRKVPEGVCAGDLLVTQLHLRNTRRRIGSWAVMAEEQIRLETSSAGDAGPPQKPIHPSVLFPYVPAGESRMGVYRGRLTQRGRYRIGPLRLSTRFPFGLFCRTITVGQTDTLTVFPRLGRLTRAWVTRRRESFAGTHRRERRPGLEGDFYGVRQWRSGDNKRRIHWRTSARAGELVVRQFEQPRNRDLAVLIDLWQPEHPTAEHTDNVELAVSFAATVAAALCRKGDANLLLASADPRPQHVAGPASTPLLQEIMHRLAVTGASAADQLPELLDRVVKQIEPGTEVVLVSTRAVDLSNTSRFAALWSNPSGRAAARQVRCIDVSSDDLDEYYHLD